MAKIERLQVKVTGVVQGVGFRPYVYRLAQQAELAGWVKNDSAGVYIEVEGHKQQLNQFLRLIKLEKPPLADIEKISTKAITPLGEVAFLIKETTNNFTQRTLVAADVAICADCAREMNDPGNRRYKYPFINCTNCGPRFTIIQNIPYDRPNTTMAQFTMCPKCQAEYENPADRRFHAQPNACPVCGPQVYLQDKHNNIIDGDPITQATRLLQAGAIITIKGLGGFHLACDASNEQAVKRLRNCKHREDKPLAIMARNLEAVTKFCLINAEEAILLKDMKRPIVLLKKKPDGAKIAVDVAPNNDYLGVMLPYTPLHSLLLADIPVGLVMTSGNHSSEPIIYRDEDALHKLNGMADYFLLHDRAIYQRCDDSVVRVFQGREMVLRRSRGYTPGSVKLPFQVKEVLACGAELKNTFCLTKKDKAFVSHHIGDLKNPVSLQAFEEGIEHWAHLFDIKPTIIAYDLHADYLSSQYALEQSNKVLCAVQHHHAHIASCMAENGVTGTVLGISFDGTGLGTDGAVWGGEFLLGDYQNFQRLGHLAYVPMVSGEQCIREPWRMAAIYLQLACGDEFTELPIPFTSQLDKTTWELLNLSRQKGINSPLTSSMGRLFDAVSALLGICQRINYEGQAAIELEQKADLNATGSYQFTLTNTADDCIEINPLPIIRGMVSDLTVGIEVASIAGKFHNTVAEFSRQVCYNIREKKGVNEIALSGGVFQNVILLEKITHLLIEDGFVVYTHSQVPPNDGGICLGQAIIASERSKNLCV